MVMPESPPEIVVVVDRENHLVGTASRARMRAECLPHRAAAVFVKNSQGAYFVQKRAATKDIYPDYLTAAAGGVMPVGEEYGDTAIRELTEELGIKNVPLVAMFDHYHESKNNRVWHRVYICASDGPFVLQASEVASGRFMTASEIAGSVAPFTPDSLAMLARLEELAGRRQMKTIFLHGLDSSGQGSKGSFFQQYFTDVYCPDFSGDLDNRLQLLEEIVEARIGLTLVASSFGGLMATCLAMRRPQAISRLILLAPALNMAGFQPPATKITIPALLFIGRGDTVTPPAMVLPLARASFADLTIHEVDDDHLLYKTFAALNWRRLLDE